MEPERNLILYVDDDANQRIVFESAFEGRFAIRTVETAAAALTVLHREPVAVLVTDQRMPDISGNELCARAKVIAPETVRMILTAYEDHARLMAATNDNLVARYLIKPWDAVELGETLRWALDAYALGREGSSVQLRLLQTERLATLGSIAAEVMHVMGESLAYLGVNAGRLVELSASAAALGELVRRYGAKLPAEDARRLALLAEELPTLAHDARQGCDEIGGLREELRRYTRPSGEAAPSTDVVAVVAYVVKICRPLARGHRAVDAELPPSLPRVAIGKSELMQVLVNLVKNAAEAVAQRTRPGGRVVVTGATRGDDVELRVLDDGPGMEPEVLARVRAATAFFSTKPQGTGLGMVQCRRVVERAGGSLAIDSVAGVGTTVSIRLKRA